MERDWDTIRDILLEIENLHGRRVLFDFWMTSNKEDMVRNYHYGLLLDNGYVSNNYNNPGSVYAIEFLTWEGHELLDSIRDESVWERTKSRLSTVGGSLSLDLLRILASEEAKSILEVV